VDDDARFVSVELRGRRSERVEGPTSFLVGERPGRVAELDHVPARVLGVDARAEVMIDLEHRVPVRLPPFTVPVEILTGRCVEGDVVHPPRQTGSAVQVDGELVADLVVVELPERDHPLLTRGRHARRVEEVLAPTTVLAGRRRRDDLDELEAHLLGVEAVRGRGIPRGEGDVMEPHRVSLPRRCRRVVAGDVRAIGSRDVPR